MSTFAILDMPRNCGGDPQKITAIHGPLKYRRCRRLMPEDEGTGMMNKNGIQKFKTSQDTKFVR